MILNISDYTLHYLAHSSNIQFGSGRYSIDHIDNDILSSPHSVEAQGGEEAGQHGAAGFPSPACSCAKGQFEGVPLKT